jgi:hypothetical protein
VLSLEKEGKTERVSKESKRVETRDYIGLSERLFIFGEDYR